MNRLTDQAVDEFFRIALAALRQENELVNTSMLRARQERSFYVGRRLGLASQREEGAGWAVFRAILDHGFAIGQTVEVLWEERYPDGKRADFLFRVPDAEGPTRVAGCLELKWTDYVPRGVERDVFKMRSNYPGPDVRKFTLIYGVEHSKWRLTDVLQAFQNLNVHTRPSWWGPGGDYSDGRFYLALGEAV